MKQMKRGMWLIAAAILGFACLVQADDMNAARERRKARKDAREMEYNVERSGL